MNRRKIILILLLFISLNVFSQTDRKTGDITNSELKESKERIDLLQKHLTKIKDSLRDCRNPIDKNHSEIDSTSLVSEYYHHD